MRSLREVKPVLRSVKNYAEVWRIPSSCSTWRLINAGLLLHSFFDPEIGGEFSSEYLADIQHNTRHHIPEDAISHNHLCENFISCMQRYIFLVLYSEIGFVSYLNNIWNSSKLNIRNGKTLPTAVWGTRATGPSGSLWRKMQHTVECHWNSPYGRTAISQIVLHWCKVKYWPNYMVDHQEDTWVLITP